MVRISNIQDGLVSLDNCVYIEGDIDKRFIINNGDLLIAMSGATTGKMGVYQYDCPALLNQRVGNIKVNTPLLLQKYRDYFMQSQGDLILKLSYGGAQPNVSAKIISDLFIPIPSLNEQEKIVAEIERWFGFIDEIENGKIELESHIKKTKSKILDLAISGKLVPQDPDDEPAIELLKRINPGFEPCDNSHYENLPQGWSVCRLEDIFNITMGQSPAGESINGKNGIEFHQGKIHYGESYLLPSGVYTDHPTKIADVDSLLLCVRAPVGVLNITQRRICIGRGLCALKPKYVTDNLYWLYVLSTYKDYFESNATGSTFKAISGDTIKNTVIKLPPRQEQQRIFNCISSLYELLNIIVAELV
ncbi:MAG: restriction endonuclease subunit S [Bacteroidales bacterium]|nr:restriction endonuclease subunit S [Bacteroidales bacterium]